MLDDAGGTEQVVYSDTVPTHAERGPAAVIDRLVEGGRGVIAAEVPARAAIGVSTRPGAIALKRIPFGA